MRRAGQFYTKYDEILADPAPLFLFSDLIDFSISSAIFQS